MVLFDQKIIAIIILVLLGFLVIVKRMASGSVLDKPRGPFLVQLVNGFNLFFLLIVNPLAAILLISGHLEIISPAGMIVDDRGVYPVLEAAGLVLYVAGFLLMAGALRRLGSNYQLGGSAPRPEDKMVVAGIYQRVRHPMYTAALSISLGLALMARSWIFLLVFFIYMVLIVLLIPVEEDGLRKVYGRQYVAYRKEAKKFIPFVY